MTKARPHPYLVNNAFPGTSRQHAKNLLDWSLINFFQPKQTPVGVTMIKSHPLPCPRVLNNSHPDSWRVCAEFRPF